MARAPRISKQSLNPETAARKEAFLANLATEHAGKQFAGIRVDNTRMGIEHLEIVFFDGSSIHIGLCTGKLERLSFEVNGISMLTYQEPLKEQKPPADEE